LIDENGDIVLYMEFPYYGVERVIIKNYKGKEVKK
jgi:hypothetical protein